MSDITGTSMVLGLGNPLMADDGVGIAALNRLRSTWEIPPSVRLEDGGTWGMTLLPLIETADRLLLLDAIRLHRLPGTLHQLGWEDLPRYLALKLSPHQIDLKEVLALCELRGSVPGEVVALGIEPGRIELDVELSPEVERGIPQLAHSAIAVLEGWGHACVPRSIGAYA
jgi:hydrogenase maturation protease